MHAPHPYLIFVIFCTPPHFLACKLYARKVSKFVTKIASRQNSVNQYWVKLAVLVGALAVLVGVLGVFCIEMVYLLHEMEHSELGMVYLVFS